MSKLATEEESSRQKALTEASNVLSALSSPDDDLFGNSSNSNSNNNNSITEGEVLDSFNLLGVVTNPFMATHIASMPSSSHGYSSSSTTRVHHPSAHSLSGVGSADSTSSNSIDTLMALPDLPSLDIASFSPQLEETLQTATDTIDNLNAIFDYYSRHYLGTLYDQDDALHHHSHSHIHSSSHHDFSPELAHNEQPSSMLPELPLELSSLDLTSVEQHLRSCGSMSAAFLQRYEKEMEEKRVDRLRRRQKKKLLLNGYRHDDEDHDHHDTKKKKKGLSKVVEGQEMNDQEELEEEEEEMEQVDLFTNVPEIFFSPYFDLTDTKTFESLLVLDDDDDNDDDNDDDDNQEQQQEKSEESEEEQQQQKSPIEQIITLPNPSTLTSHLDEIELNLLEQVRSKSSSFFRETTRFSTLKTLIATSVTDVVVLRKDIQGLLSKMVKDVEVIPNMDRQREELKVLGKVCDMVTCVSECKNSIAGLMAAGDYLGALEAIFVARKLLKGKHSLDDDDDDEEDHIESDDYNNKEHETQGESKHNTKNTVELGKLRALSKVSEQLQQYEELAVMRLTNELVDIFLNWNSSSSSSSSLSTNNHNDSNPNFSSLETTTTTTSDDLITSNNATTSQQSIRSRVKDIVYALRKCSKLDLAAKAYKDKLCEVVKVTVRTTVTECAADIATAPSSNTTTTSGTTVNNSSKEEKKEGGENKLTTTTTTTKSSITAGVTSMSFTQFLNCLDMLLEQVLVLLRAAVGVQKYLREEDIVLKDEEYEVDADVPFENGEEKNGGGGENDAVPPPPTTPAATPTTASTRSTSSSSSSSPDLSNNALSASSELAHKSVSELLRLRKDSHSLITFDEMKSLWDASLAFTLQLEKYSGRKAYNLRGTLLAQAKAFVERKHEANMASLVAALDGERWTQCDVSAERQAALTRLCSGRAVLSTTKLSSKQRRNSNTDTNTTSNTKSTTSSKKNKMSDAEVEGKRYKVVWSNLLLIEMIMSNVACAAHFQTLATNVVGKVVELLRLFNSRSTHLVLMAGAIHSAARLKSINAKHLALVTQCLGLVIAILPHVRAALMAQLPSKQHTLLVDLDRVKKEYEGHNEKVLSKFVSIIGGIVEHGLAPRISKIDFDARATKAKESHAARVKNGGDDAALVVTAENVTCCPFLDGISTNTKKMHQVLSVLLPEEHLQDVFSRIFAYVDSKVPSLFIAAAASSSSSSTSDGGGGGGSSSSSNSFSMPQTEDGKRRMVIEVEAMSIALNHLSGVQPWEFSAMKVLEKKLDINLNTEEVEKEVEKQEEEGEGDDEEKAKTNGESEEVSNGEVAKDSDSLVANGEIHDGGDDDKQGEMEEQEHRDTDDDDGANVLEAAESATEENDNVTATHSSSSSDSAQVVIENDNTTTEAEENEIIATTTDEEEKESAVSDKEEKELPATDEKDASTEENGGMDGTAT